MFKTLSVLIPTRGRVVTLQAMLASYEATEETHPELVFRVDEDDTTTIDFLRPLGHTLLIGPRGEGYRSLPQFYNELYRGSHGDLMMCGNDDMIFRTPGWDRLILERANEYPDGIFDFGVTTHNHLNFPFATVARKTIDRLGFLYDPRIFWGDIYLLGVMAAFNRAIMLSDIIIDHDWMGAHPDATFVEGDQVRRSNWMTWHQVAIDEAVEKLSEDPAIRALRTKQTVIDRGGWSIVLTEG